MLGMYRVREQRAACAQWPHAHLSPEFRLPVESNAPTLILTGDRDPVTPPRLGDEVVRHLPNGRHVVIPQGAHVPFGIEPVACLDGIMLRFFADPWAKSLDTACVASMRAKPFVLQST